MAQDRMMRAVRRLPHERDYEVVDAFSFLRAFVDGCDSHGRWPEHLATQLCWWMEPDRAQVAGWVQELIAGEFLIRSLDERDIFSGEKYAVLTLVGRSRYRRFAKRKPIPKKLRETVYQRDGRRCLTCGATERLSLDHIRPHSLGGSDSIENLQTLCLSCNSSKGATF